MRRVVLFCSVLIATVIVDQATKIWASSRGLVVLNTGISFGVGNFSQNMVIVCLICLTVAAAVSWWRWASSSPRHVLAAGLFFAGALSNILDRLLYGAVRDWLPLLIVKNNLADWAIFLGILLLLWPRTIQT